MRILIIHQYYLGKEDAGGSRFNQFAKYWAQQGHYVTVIAGMVHYATGKKDDRYKWRWIVKEKEGERIQVLRSYVSQGYNRSFRGRIWAYLSFALSATWAGLFYSGPQDLVLASSPPLFVGIPGYVISRVKRIPLLFEVRDLWPDFAVETGILTNRLAIRLAYWLERVIYQKAALINVLTPAYREALVRKGVPEQKLVLIPNGADLDIFQPGNKNNWVRATYGWGDRFVVLYTGAHGVANQLSQIIEAAKELKEHKGILFVLVGDGMEKPLLQQRAEKYGLTNVQFIEAQPKEKIADFINAADVCIAVLKKVEGFKMVYPNKLFDYMACAKPVILGIDGVARELLEEARAGIYVEPENVEHIVEAVLRLYRECGLIEEYGRNGYKYAQQYFSRKRLAEQYEAIIRRVVAHVKKRKALSARI